ncbi:uncharacterized protein LOC143891670 [Tasmannia lanceolata]|uniref:uncharacterized protein LOC143891670 n=1 Tax=Tasmannia lanceolata TaxID=3420 RepID=UPI004063CE1C
MNSLDQLHLDGTWNPILNIGSLSTEKALLSETIFTDSNRNLPIWKPNSNGFFTAKSGWEVSRQKIEKPAWASRIWFSNHVPRHALVSWKALKNGLSTMDNLPFLDPSVNRRCLLCNYGLESVNHLFFQSRYSKWIWQYLLGMLGHFRSPQPDLLQEELWLANSFKGSGQSATLAFLAFEASIYRIWAERNQRVFHKKSLLNSVLLPPPGSFKINSDASLEDVGGGIGGTIRDSNGFLVSMFSINVEREDILTLEILGVLTSLQQALQMGCGIIWLEVDSKSTADIINGLLTIPWRSFRRIKEIQLLLSRFQRWSITHIWREGNCVADFLSKRKCPGKGVNISPFLSPPALLQLLDSDRAGTEYYRK